MRRIAPITLALIVLVSIVNAQSRIGDPGRVFDSSQDAAPDNITNFQSKRQRWANAGVQGGIRITGSGYEEVFPLADVNADATAIIQAAIDQVVLESNNAGGVVILKAGTYTLKNTVNMAKGVTLKGEGPGNSGTKIRIDKADESIILFDDIDQNSNFTSGVRDMYFEGIEGVPNPSNMSNAKTSYDANVIQITRSKNCYVDNVRITNSGNSPISTWSGNNHTFRDVDIDGCWNKGGGGSCYFALQSHDCLVYSCNVVGLRHFTLQREHCEYNVVYDNDLLIDVNFHNADVGNNLIENNRITLPAYLGSASGRRYVVMGPWSTQHAPTVSGRDNYVYNNDVDNIAFGGTPRCNLKDRVYRGADIYEPGTGANQTPPLPSGNPFASSNFIGLDKTIYATIDANALSTDTFEKAEASIQIYPTLIEQNDAVTIKVPSGNSDVLLKIANIQGATLSSERLQQGTTHQINVSFASSGLYIVNITSKEGSFQKKIMIK